METGLAEQVHDSSLHAIIVEQLRKGNDTDRLQRFWDIIRQEQLHVTYQYSEFPIISGNLPLSQQLITRARPYLVTSKKEECSLWPHAPSFVQQVLAGGGVDMSSLYISLYHPRDSDEYRIEGV